MSTKVIPRTDFIASGGDVAEDQFCQQVETAIPVQVLKCNQDFVDVTVVLSRGLTAPEEAAFATIVATHDAVGRVLEGTVAQLSPGLFEGEEGYATDGRKVGEGVGSGTGVPVYWSTGSWRVFSTDQAVEA